MTEVLRGGLRSFVFFFQAEDGIRDLTVTGVQTCALPICLRGHRGDRRRVSARRDLPPLLGGNGVDGLSQQERYHPALEYQAPLRAEVGRRGSSEGQVSETARRRRSWAQSPSESTQAPNGS